MLAHEKRAIIGSNQTYLKFSVEFGFINDESRKGAKVEAKPADSELLAAGSNSDYGLQDSKQ